MSLQTIRVFWDDHDIYQCRLAQVEHDVYHRIEYLKLCADMEGGRALTLCLEEGESYLLLGCVVRHVPAVLDQPDAQDATTPYGYSPPLLHATSEESRVRLLTAMCEALREIGMVALFIRGNPMLVSSVDALHILGTVRGNGQVAVIDLAGDAPCIWNSIKQRHRTTIHHLRKAGFTVELGSWECFPDFQRIYLETMERLGATDYYRFSSNYFATLRDAMGSHMFLGVVKSPSGEVAAGALFFQQDRISHYHLSGTNAKYTPDAPMKLLILEASLYLQRRGVRWLNLGGGLGGADDSLLFFKRGFTSHLREFTTARVVVDAARYATLCRVHDERYGALGDESGFFPAYRQGL